MGQSFNSGQTNAVVTEPVNSLNTGNYNISDTDAAVTVSSGAIVVSDLTYATIKTYTISNFNSLGTTIRVQATIFAASGRTGYFRPYVNGVAVGVEQTVTNTTASVDQDITIKDGDVVEFKFYASTVNISVNSIKILGDLNAEIPGLIGVVS